MTDWQARSASQLDRAIALPSVLSKMFHWIVLRTRAACEYQALRNLSLLGVTAYLPRLAEIRRRGFSRQAQQYPMFPGYIFAQPHDGLPTIYGVTGAVMRGDKLAQVDGGIIDEIKRRENSAGVIDLGEETLAAIHPGDHVRIVAGPFADLVGRLCKLKNGRERAIVLLDESERLQRVEVGSRDLRLISS